VDCLIGVKSNGYSKGCSGRVAEKEKKVEKNIKILWQLRNWHTHPHKRCRIPYNTFVDLRNPSL
jgi:hypothetical protein